MLNILGHPYRFCDGVTRRSFLRIGGLAMGGLTMPELLRAESSGQSNPASSGSARGSSSGKSIIMIFLPGGPPHQDMFDLKMDAPAEIRGEFTPIKTSVPGIEICEMMPRLAAMMDKLILIRSIVGATGGHDAFQCLTGRSLRNQPPGGWPALGSVLSQLQGSGNSVAPPFVGLSPPMGHMEWADAGQPGFLGPARSPFKPNGQGKDDMRLTAITAERLQDRRTLLKQLDNYRRAADARGLMDGFDTFNQQAFGLLTSSQLVDALDLAKEDPRLVARYGKGKPKNVADGGPRLMEHFLMARRLVEAGVRCVTCAFSRWDWHGGNFRRGREDMPMLDQGLSALVEDLHARGLDKDVTVVVWGEFGRTPQINKNAGRDHWPRVSCALLACGGMRTGQVLGATDRLGGEATDRPVHFQDVFATLYHNLGIDVTRVTLPDLTGRPRFLVDNDKYGVIREVV
jgi:hypothetical protein